MGASEGTRFPDAAVFHPLFIAIPWTRNPGPMLIFSRLQGARQRDWANYVPIMSYLPSYE